MVSRGNAEETFKYLREVKLEPVLRPKLLDSDPDWFINQILSFFKRVINPNCDSNLICHTKTSKLSPVLH